MERVRIYEMPDCKMASSGIGMFGEQNFEQFNRWFSALPRDLFPKDFLFWDGDYSDRGGFHWLYRYEDGMEVPEAFSVIDFKGGLYAVITGIDGQDNGEEQAEIKRFLEEYGFERDDSRPELGNVITPPQAADVLGYFQMDYYTPIRKKLK